MPIIRREVHMKTPNQAFNDKIGSDAHIMLFLNRRIFLFLAVAFLVLFDHVLGQGKEEHSEVVGSCISNKTKLNLVEVIAKKRDGQELALEEITSIVHGYNEGHIPDYQMSALLMAIYIRGLTDSETAAMTAAFTSTGQTLDLSALGATVDKHSTGGVGDKTSLALAPLVASLGLVVPMMSGRGLGHTGGTLDKLESIPGLRTNLTTPEFLAQLVEIGVAISGPTESVAPVDKKVYALRDVTATTSSLPLMVASIMSKKLAEGAAALLLDVKTGSGAFLTDMESSKALARMMVAAGNNAGRTTIAVLTSNDQPLGLAIGNTLELVEAARLLYNATAPRDLHEIVQAECALMLQLAKRPMPFTEAFDKCQANIQNGKAFAKLLQLVERQGGNRDAFMTMVRGELAPSQHRVLVTADQAGFVHRIESSEIGLCSVALGAGRVAVHSKIDHKAGILLHAKVGDYVEVGGLLAEILTDIDQHLHIVNRVRSAFRLTASISDASAQALIGHVVMQNSTMIPWTEFVQNGGFL